MTDPDVQSSTPSIKILIVGPVPPPVGGVASSVYNMFTVLSKRDDVRICTCKWQELWKYIFCKSLLLHLNFSKSKKRLLGTLLARILGWKVVHTVHGNQFDFNLVGNAWSVRLSHGFILLNSSIYERFQKRGVKNIRQFTPTFSNDLGSGDSAEKLPPELLRNIYDKGGKWIAVYANGKRLINGNDLYGFDFIGKLLPRLKKLGYTVIFLDPANEYSSSELDPDSCGAYVHCRVSVDFTALLSVVDAYVRPTCSDGNSVAVHEALDSGVPVIASDVVPRPVGTLTYEFQNYDSFIKQLLRAQEGEECLFESSLTDASEYVDFIREISLGQS